MSSFEMRSELPPDEEKFSRMTATSRLRITYEQTTWKETKKASVISGAAEPLSRASNMIVDHESPVRH